MDWAYELARNPDASDMRCHNGVMQIHIQDSDAEYGGSGWYSYNRRWKDLEEARALVVEKVGSVIIVPTDLVSPLFAHIQPEMAQQR